MKQKRVISFLLILILSFSFINPIFSYVYAEEEENSVQTRQSNFLNYWANSDGIVLSSKNLTTTDYYTLYVYISNWFEPGKTTLKDLTSPENSELIKTIASSFGFSDSTLFFEIVKSFGDDFRTNGIKSGKSVLWYKTSDGNKIASGLSFLYALFGPIESGLTNTSKVTQLHCEKGSKIALDFNSDAVRAAFQILNAYNPNLFSDANGIESLDFTFEDAVGNIWGGKLSDTTSEAVKTELKGFLDFSAIGPSVDWDSLLPDENIYLILPACLNPATFSPKVTNNKNAKDLRLPLMNSFTLPYLLESDSFENANIEDIPFYNLIAKAKSGSFSKVQNSRLSIFCVNSLTPYLGKTGMIPNMEDGILKSSDVTWLNTDRRKDFANVLYRSDLVALERNDGNKGIGKYGTNSYVVISPNLGLNSITSSADNTNSSTKNYIIDIRASWPFGQGSNRYTVFENSLKTDLSLKYTGYLFTALYSPIFLDFNHICMTMYLSDDIVSESDSPYEEYSKYLTENQFAAKMGMTGLSLFFESSLDGQLLEGGTLNYTGLSPANNCVIESNFIKKLRENANFIPNDWAEFYKKATSKKNVEDLLPESKINSDFVSEMLNIVTPSESDFNLVKYNTLFGYPTTSGEETHLNLCTVAENQDTYGETPDSIGSTSYLTLNSHLNYVIRFQNLNTDYAVFSPLVSLEDSKLIYRYMDAAGFVNIKSKEISPRAAIDFMLTEYGYTLFFPSEATLNAISTETVSINSMFGSSVSLSTSMANLSKMNKIGSGIYFGYIMDMYGVSSLIESTDEKSGSFSPGSLNTTFLPVYSISANGSLDYVETKDSDVTGVVNSENTSFEQMQEDLIRRIYGLTNDRNNDYRNSLIKNILEGFILTIHRTITGTWYSNVNTITSGNSSTYQSVTGYIYTPTLEELSFTATMMNNYINIYIICMVIVLFLLILMTLLHMRTWQQSLLISLIMSVALLFPYILISNSVNISNKVSDSIYSDRFDFWALSNHYSTRMTIKSTSGMSEKDALLTRTSATTDTTNGGDTGVKIKWMSPKKVEMFKNLYSDTTLSESFVTNMEIFKWLFNSTIYDSEYVDTDVFGNYLYRPYTNIAEEAIDYYYWGKELSNNLTSVSSVKIEDVDYTFNGIPTIYYDSLNFNEDVKREFLSSFIRIDSDYYLEGSSKLTYSSEKLSDVKTVKAKNDNKNASIIGLWGSVDSNELSKKIFTTDDFTLDSYDYGITSNLPSVTYGTGEIPNSLKESPDNLSRAIFLKNTESPYFYFYSVLRNRYADSGTSGSFKKSLLDSDIFKVSSTENSLLNTDRNVSNAYRDFLDLEGLFTFMIPYLRNANNYVINWQSVNDSEISEYNFEYDVDESGEAINIGVTGYDENGNPISELGKEGNSGYEEAVRKKNQLNKIWNMYSPWVDSLYSLDVLNKRISVGSKKITISDTLNPSSYLEQGRPMIFSEADMIVKGYTYKDLTDVERKIQAVLEKTYTDLMYLINYYDMDDEVLLSAAAMYATFNFNKEFSKTSILGDSIMLYPQGFELKNFNYDAYMRLALLNSTGESVFATDDLYTRVLSKTSVFTGLLLIICDIVACIAIPMFKFIILVGLLFLGILVCIACVVNPPDKIFEAVCKSLVLPTILFMALNIVFAWVMSLIVGEGLTAYVGSKTVNFATNDPTVTMLIMALLGVAYLFCAWKILKFLVAAYKQFGLSTALAAVGIVGAAIAGGTSGIAKTAGRLVGGGVGAGIGAATSSKGNRLSGALEGAGAGTKGIIGKRLRDKSMAEAMAKSLPSGTVGSKKTTDKINNLASTQGSGNDKSVNTNKQASQEKAKVVGSVKTTSEKGKPTPPSELDRDFKKATDKNANFGGRVLSNFAYMQAKAQDTLDGIKYKKTQTGFAIENAKLNAMDTIQNVKNMPNKVKNSAKNYINRSVETMKSDSEFYQLVRQERNSERIDRLAKTGMAISNRGVQRRKEEGRKKRVDTEYDAKYQELSKKLSGKS